MPHFILLMLYGNGIELETCLRVSPCKWDMSQPPKVFIARVIMPKSRWNQISRYSIDPYFKFLKSEILICLYLVSLLRSYGSHLLDKMSPSPHTCVLPEKF